MALPQEDCPSLVDPQHGRDLCIHLLKFSPSLSPWVGRTRGTRRRREWTEGKKEGEKERKELASFPSLALRHALSPHTADDTPQQKQDRKQRKEEKKKRTDGQERKRYREEAEKRSRRFVFGSPPPPPPPGAEP